MNQPSPSDTPQSAVDQQALDWFVRRERSLTAGEAAQFEAWLALDDAHRAAYARWHGDWTRLDALPADGIAQLRRQLAVDQAAASVPVSASRRDWFKAMAPRAALATLALSATGGGYLAWQHWQRQPVYTASFASARGQQQAVTLPDGSVLRLDTATRVNITLYRQRREVRLLEGQAVFQVHGDTARPFDVLAGAMRITVVGTRFSVRHTPGTGSVDDVRVEVEEGRVRVARSSTPDNAPFVTLGAGQRIAADRAGRLGEIKPVTQSGIAPWREGRVNFDDTPLAEVLAEFARYRHTGLVLRDARVAQLRVTGSFDPLRLDNFLRVLPRVLPVQLRREGGVTEIAAL